MQNVPKIVRERLKAAATIVNHLDSHPDANVLTAFAERSLGENERGVVLDHLARCGDCRDIDGFNLATAGQHCPVDCFGDATGAALCKVRNGFCAKRTVCAPSV